MCVPQLLFNSYHHCSLSDGAEKENVNDTRGQGPVTAGMVRRAKKAVFWVSKEFELLALASDLPLDLGWVDSFDSTTSLGRKMVEREPLWSFKAGKSQIFSFSDFIGRWL